MTRQLFVKRAGPGMTVQDAGRTGYLALGLSRSGAADRLALVEGAALLGQDANLPVLEMVGFGGEFEVSEPTRIALTGAPMRATINQDRIVWNASHLLLPGDRLAIGAAEQGNYGYLHVGGGLNVPDMLGSASVHLAAQIGGALETGDSLAVGADTRPDLVPMKLEATPRFEGGIVRMVAGPQTHFFALEEQQRFQTTTFQRDARGNRMGVRLDCKGDGFHSEAGLSVLSEVIIPGDIQITGDGSPYVLLSECQTTGGYPRIGSVLPSDLPRVAQARPGTTLLFRFVSDDEAIDLERKEMQRRSALGQLVQPLVRDPKDIRDLLSYQLISGVVSGNEDEGNGT